jgi:hypothetical protein
MSNLSNLEPFERFIKAKGRILRAEADRTGPTSEVLALTFDLGRVLIRSSDQGLIVSEAKDRTALPEGMVSLDEEEPWWRLLGQPISAARPAGVEGGIEAAEGAPQPAAMLVLNLRFGEASNHSRIVCLEAIGRLLRISLDEA